MNTLNVSLSALNNPKKYKNIGHTAIKAAIMFGLTTCVIAYLNNKRFKEMIENDFLDCDDDDCPDDDDEFYEQNYLKKWEDNCSGNCYLICLLFIEFYTKN